MRRWMFTPLDWTVAWRHVRMGETRPAWVAPLIIGAVYLLIVGIGFAVRASVAAPEPFELLALDEELGPTPLQRYYGVFGGVTLFIALMALVFGLLSRFFNLLSTIITMSVLLGCMALVVVLSLMSGLEGDLRDKILNQKAHIRIARADGRPFSDYMELVQAVAEGSGVAGASPYIEGEIMVRSGLNRQGAIFRGILPGRQTEVSNLAELVREGEYGYLENPGDIPDPDPFSLGATAGTPWRLRHLEEERKGKRAKPRTDLDLDDDPGDEDDESFDDGGWEDPAATLAAADKLPSLPPPPAERDLEDGWEDPASELGVPLPSVPADAEPDEPALDDPELEEQLADEAIVDPILIGRELAMELGVRVGTQVQLITPVGRMTPVGRKPGVMGAKVAGVFFSGMYEYDRKNVYAPLEVVQRFLHAADSVSGIEVKLDDVDRMDEGKAVVEAIVARAGHHDELLVEDWRDLNRNLFSAMFLEKVAMFIALLFVVLVASFGILASNLMSVMEKSKEIAILKAMGTTDQGILRVFVAEGLCVGILGSLGGIGMGLGLCWALDRFGFPLNENVYYIENLPVVVNPIEVALVGICSLIIVWLSSLYPALLASRMRPIEGLRQADE